MGASPGRTYRALCACNRLSSISIVLLSSVCADAGGQTVTSMSLLQPTDASTGFASDALTRTSQFAASGTLGQNCEAVTGYVVGCGAVVLGVMGDVTWSGVWGMCRGMCWKLSWGGGFATVAACRGGGGASWCARCWAPLLQHQKCTQEVGLLLTTQHLNVAAAPALNAQSTSHMAHGLPVGCGEKLFLPKKQTPLRVLPDPEPPGMIRRCCVLRGFVRRSDS